MESRSGILDMLTLQVIAELPQKEHSMDNPQPQQDLSVDTDHPMSIRQLTRHSYAIVLAGGAAVAWRR